MNDKRYILPLINEIKGFIVRNMINALLDENVQMKNKKGCDLHRRQPLKQTKLSIYTKNPYL